MPSSTSEAQSILETKNGFLNNLIVPTVNRMTDDGYCYVLPSVAMECAIATGLSIEFVTMGNHDNNDSTNHRSIFRSKIMHERVNELSGVHQDDYIVPFGIWSDGYDAGKMSKANRSLVKLTTVHVSHPSNSKCHVFPVAFGKNKADHENVRRILWDDVGSLNRASRRCFIPNLSLSARVRFCLTYIIQDRPEHTEWTGFASHNGKFSTVPGISCPIRISGTDPVNRITDVRVTKQLSSCRTCYERRISLLKQSLPSSGISVDNCDDCNDWGLLNCTYVPDDRYP